METKISLTFYDIVSHLIPGSTLILTIYYFGDLGKELNDGQALVFLLVFGFISGVFLHLIGLLLFKPFFIEDFQQKPVIYFLVKTIDTIVKYSPVLKVHTANGEIKASLIKAIKAKLKIDLVGKRLGLFSVADTYVASLPFGERDVLSAKEGLFRSLTALVVIETIYLYFFVPFYNKLLIVIIGLIFTELSRYGREYYRTIKNQQIYTLALIKLKQ